MYRYAKISILFLLLFFSGGIAGEAQQKTFTVSGMVRDLDTGDPVPYATVLVEETGLWSISDADGSFRLSMVPAGAHTFRVEILGYVKKPFRCR